MVNNYLDVRLDTRRIYTVKKRTISIDVVVRLLLVWFVFRRFDGQSGVRWTVMRCWRSKCLITAKSSLTGMRNQSTDNLFLKVRYQSESAK